MVDVLRWISTQPDGQKSDYCQGVKDCRHGPAVQISAFVAQFGCHAKFPGRRLRFGICGDGFASNEGRSVEIFIVRSTGKFIVESLYLVFGR
jgi:hypothetical protein